MKIFGQNPIGAHRKLVQESVHFKEGAFKNLTETIMLTREATPLAMIRELLNPPPGRIPKNKIPSIKSSLYDHGQTAPVITWFGHSSYHISIEGKCILVDPVFCGHASPFPFMIKSFPGTDIYNPNDFQTIDLLILTHDHYDHLDYKTLLQLKGKVKKICCSLGVGSHLVYWGFDKKIITELDWWENSQFDNLHITAVPARHFSGRVITRSQTLWSGFVLKAGNYQLFLGGDSGYGDHFSEIGKRFGGFDIAILECGQYNVKWPMIHMMPEETVQASIDLNSKYLMPVHWGKFALAYHAWDEPVERAWKAGMDKHVKMAIPMIGESVIIDKIGDMQTWWKEVK